jgi:D-arabinose 1-dehydrogenase-like Zn-dependent alcohol dehydrogenase
MGFRTVAINRGRDREALVRRLEADEYIDSNEGRAGEALTHLGGATVAISTVGASPAQVDLIPGLRPNGRLVVIASDHQPLEPSANLLVPARRQVAGWYNGHAKGSEEAMRFADLKGVRPMIELHPLDEAETTFQNMHQAQFRAVLTM